MSPEETALRIAIYSKMVRIPRDREWIEVDSAFGGLAIYRKAVLTGASYRGSGRSRGVRMRTRRAPCRDPGAPWPHLHQSRLDQFRIQPALVRRVAGFGALPPRAETAAEVAGWRGKAQSDRALVSHARLSEPRSTGRQGDLGGWRSLAESNRSLHRERVWFGSLGVHRRFQLCPFYMDFVHGRPQPYLDAHLHILDIRWTPSDLHLPQGGFWPAPFEMPYWTAARPVAGSRRGESPISGPWSLDFI